MPSPVKNKNMNWELFLKICLKKYFYICLVYCLVCFVLLGLFINNSFDVLLHHLRKTNLIQLRAQTACKSEPLIECKFDLNIFPWKKGLCVKTYSWHKKIWLPVTMISKYKKTSLTTLRTGQCENGIHRCYYSSTC